MTPQPIYPPESVLRPAYQLRFSWSCWPSEGRRFPPLVKGLLEEADAKWETDGIRRLEHNWSPERIHITVSVKPHVSPVLLAGRLKGRLDHALRQAGTPVRFSRKVSLRSLGDATRAVVEEYIRKQIPKARFVDPRTESLLSQFTVRDPEVELSAPTESNSGRYWYNLHLVLVTAERLGCFDPDALTKIRDGCFRIAEKKGHRISAASVVPDHVHVAMRGNIEQPAHEIALAFMNNLAYLLGSAAIWQCGYYVGTFGEYDMRSVRRGPQAP
jgi:REP element-mobilizing transposase RayT